MPTFRAETLRTYRVSRGNASYCVVFSLIWFGLTVRFWIIDLLRDYGWRPATVLGSLVLLLIALLPALMTASSSMSISLIDDDQCELRSLLHRCTL